MPTARAQPTGFVRVEGDRFTLDGAPFVFVGANVDVTHGDLFRAQHRETLGALTNDGLRVARVWAFGEGDASCTWCVQHSLFRIGPDAYVEAAYTQLDHVLAEAEARGLHLILTLSNNWSDYGGVETYLRWAGLPTGTGPNDRAREAFYSDERVRALFRTGLERLLRRVNTVTGRRYVDDPTILSWELMNESSVPTPAGAEARLGWIAEMARFIRERDPNHLVAAGVANYGSRDERAQWLRACALPEVDYCDSHLYPDAADDIAPRRRDADAARALRRLRDFIDDRAQLARFVARKPLVIGEFGFRTDGAPRGKRRADASRRQGLLAGPRARWFRNVLERVFRDGGAGALVWIYQPWTGKARDFGIYIDRPDTDDVRDALRRIARRLRSGPALAENPRLGPAVGDRFLYDPLRLVRGTSRVHSRWKPEGDDLRLDIPPEAFADGQFEKLGVLRHGAPLLHAWGSGFGRFRYRFAAPSGRPVVRLRVRARLSSEWPGRTAPLDGGSLVSVSLDGARVAVRKIVPDDGLGAAEDFVIDDSVLLRRLSRPGSHVLTFEVPAAPGAHGLCIYGAPTGDQPLTRAATSGISGTPNAAPDAARPKQQPSPPVAAATTAASVPAAPPLGPVGPIRLQWERSAPPPALGDGSRAPIQSRLIP